MQTNVLKNIEELSTKFTNVEEVKIELKRVQSVKCRLLKQKARKDYDVEMSKVVNYEQALKEVRSYFEPKEKPVTMFDEKDIAVLNYEETMKAIKSIQSKKCNSQYLTDDINTNQEYQDALKVEALLLAHKKTVKPIEDTVVKKSDLSQLIQHIETLEEKISKEYVIELLQKMIDQE